MNPSCFVGPSPLIIAPHPLRGRRTQLQVRGEQLLDAGLATQTGQRTQGYTRTARTADVVWWLLNMQTDTDSFFFSITVVDGQMCGIGSASLRSSSGPKSLYQSKVQTSHSCFRSPNQSALGSQAADLSAEAPGQIPRVHWTFDSARASGLVGSGLRSAKGHSRYRPPMQVLLRAKSEGGHDPFFCSLLPVR